MSKATLIALSAVLRRAGISIGVGLLAYLAGAIPEHVIAALKSDEATVILVPLAIWLIEFIQKLWRERRK